MTNPPPKQVGRGRKRSAQQSAKSSERFAKQTRREAHLDAGRGLAVATAYSVNTITAFAVCIRFSA
jgi:hypothetical protein